jgi:hypothetical protein
MVVVAQLVRASDCDSEGRGFEPHHPPVNSPRLWGFYFKMIYNNPSIKPYILFTKPLLIQFVSFKVQI